MGRVSVKEFQARELGEFQILFEDERGQIIGSEVKRGFQ